MAIIDVDNILKMVPQIVDSQHNQIWFDYDKAADVLYVNFHRPSRADDSELTDDDIIVRSNNGAVVGYTVLNASTR